MTIATLGATPAVTTKSIMNIFFKFIEVPEYK